MIEHIQSMIANTEATIGVLESRLSSFVIPTQTDMQLHDRINFHHGAIHGLRQALFVLIADEEIV